MPVTIKRGAAYGQATVQTRPRRLLRGRWRRRGVTQYQHRGGSQALSFCEQRCARRRTAREPAALVSDLIAFAFTSPRRFNGLFVALPRTKPAIVISGTVPSDVPAKARLRIPEPQSSK